MSVQIYIKKSAYIPFHSAKRENDLCTFDFFPTFAAIMTHDSIYTLKNGLRIIHRQDPSPVVYCGYVIGTGSRHELPGEEGLAHFVEHTTFKGTKRRKAWDIINGLECVGGELNAYTNKENTVYYAALLNEHIGLAIDLLTDIVNASTYPEKEIGKEKEVVCDEIDSCLDSPPDLIFDEFENIIFRGHPLGHNILGTENRVRSFCGADTLRFARKHYRPENMVFFVSGNVDMKIVVDSLEQQYARLDTTIPTIDLPAPPLDHTDSQRKYQLMETGEGQYELLQHTHQTHVMMGCGSYNRHDDRRMPLFLLNNLLGGPGMNSRLNVSLRERNALVYTVESYSFNYSDKGTWGIYFGCDSHDRERCMQLVRKELDTLMQQRLTPDELFAAKRQVKGQLRIAADNRENAAIDMGRHLLCYGREKDLDEVCRVIDGITASQIQEVAQEIFHPQRLVSLVIS